MQVQSVQEAKTLGVLKLNLQGLSVNISSSLKKKKVQLKETTHAVFLSLSKDFSPKGKRRS